MWDRLCTNETRVLKIMNTEGIGEGRKRREAESKY
jgi:hypothetical protein